MDTKFAENIKTLRKDAGLSQATIAKLVGVSQPCVSEWENKKIEPTLSYLWKLADIFEITVDELIGRKDF